MFLGCEKSFEKQLRFSMCVILVAKVTVFRASFAKIIGLFAVSFFPNSSWHLPYSNALSRHSKRSADVAMLVHGITDEEE